MRKLISLGQLRFFAFVLGLSVILGEMSRSWGGGGPLVFFLDDMIMGSLLIFAALAISHDTTRRRAFFGAAWGANAAMLYGSFFGKVFSPEASNSGNWNLNVLTVLIGCAFVFACIGTFLTITLPRE